MENEKNFQEEVNEAQESEENKVIEQVVEEQQQDEEIDEQQDNSAEEDEEEKLKQEKLEEERKRKQEAYYKRQEEKRQKQLQQANELTYQQQNNSDNLSDDRLAELEKVAQQLKHQQIFQGAKRELQQLETEFVEAFPDYNDIVDEAMEFAKHSLVSKGLSEADALVAVEREKVIIADRAAANGKDPVEAVYKEAMATKKIFDEYAKKRGYIKVETQTNLDKVRNISNPSAVKSFGGSGKGVQKPLKDDDDAIINMSIGDLLQASKDGKI